MEKQKLPKLEELDEFPKNFTYVKDFARGEYIRCQYAKRTFRGKEQMVVYVIPKENEDVEPIPIHGYFLKEELKKNRFNQNGSTYIYIRLGIEKNTESRNKDKDTTIASTQIKQKFIQIYITIYAKW